MRRASRRRRRRQGTYGRLLLQNHAAGKEVRGLFLLGTPHPWSSDPIATAIHGALAHGQQLKVSPHLSFLSLSLSHFKLLGLVLPWCVFFSFLGSVFLAHVGATQSHRGDSFHYDVSWFLLRCPRSSSTSASGDPPVPSSALLYCTVNVFSCFYHLKKASEKHVWVL